jgi:hypothetical protein
MKEEVAFREREMEYKKCWRSVLFILSFIYLFIFVILEFELKTSRLLGRHSTT